MVCPRSTELDSDKEDGLPMILEGVEEEEGEVEYAALMGGEGGFGLGLGLGMDMDGVGGGLGIDLGQFSFDGLGGDDTSASMVEAVARTAGTHLRSGKYLSPNNPLTSVIRKGDFDADQRIAPPSP
eukprot:82813-Prorocentrum_minimum.AAC.1